MNSTPIRIGVDVQTPYDVVIGRRVLGELPGMLGDGVRRVLIVYPGPLREVARRIRGSLTVSFETHLAEVPDAEAAKTVEVAAGLWRELGRAGFTRSDAIVAVGGGATTDLAGFVAATWLRGIAVVHVPTTILAMVDAAVGGKTGINTGEGKNLVGAFHSPRGVLADTAMLETLDRWDFVEGLAEVVKAGLIADTTILDLVDAHAPALRGWGSAPATEATWSAVTELIHRSVRVKADVVSVDLLESGLREILNYGHTLAHAIELTEDYQWRHGAAVSVGMMYAANLAKLAGLLDADQVARHRDVLESLGLPLTYRGDRWDRLLAAMHRDKKTRGNRLRFVVLDAIGHPTRLEGPDPDLLTAAYAAISADAPTD